MYNYVFAHEINKLMTKWKHSCLQNTIYNQNFNVNDFTSLNNLFKLYQ